MAVPSIFALRRLGPHSARRALLPTSRALVSLRCSSRLTNFNSYDGSSMAPPASGQSPGGAYRLVVVDHVLDHLVSQSQTLLQELQARHPQHPASWRPRRSPVG